MKSTIIFFDNFTNSGIRGTLRGCVIFPIYIILTLLWFYITKKALYDKHIDTDVSKSRIIVSLLFSGLLIVSALGVHTPDTKEKAVVYAALVGFVVYGISNATLLATSNKWDYTISIIDTIMGICLTAFLGLILFLVVQKWNNILGVV